ncbi:DUF2520 domain-containing protein [candidate division WOR-3 bacterium]|nr:DUF2520 domain-containing protein [candidate division WOR-3 bacterium]
MKVGFGLLGAGSLGLSLASVLDKTLGRITGVYDTDETAQKRAVMVLECQVLSVEDLAKSSDVLLFAVPDEQIAPLFKSIPPRASETALLVHFSGVLTSDIFGETPMRLSAHPAMTFPQPRTQTNVFKDVIFALEGTECAIDIFEPVLEEIGARSFSVSPDDKPLYHAVCTMSSNLLLGLLNAVNQLKTKTGIDDTILEKVILDLAQSSIKDAQAQPTLAAALSGPIIRGDKSSVALHLNALERFPAQRKLYRMLSQWVLELAKEKGLSKSNAQEIEELLLR